MARPAPGEQALVCWQTLLIGVWLTWASSTTASADPPALVRLAVEPHENTLRGRDASMQLIATGHYADGTVRVLSDSANWSSAERSVLTVDGQGQVTARHDGQTDVVARVGSLEASA